MSDEFATLSELDLLSLIKRAEGELEHRKKASREKLREEIREKLRASGMDLSDLFPETGAKKRRTKAAPDDAEAKELKPKYRDAVSQETWSGRGAHPPLWVKRVMAERAWSLEDFKKSRAYEA